MKRHLRKVIPIKNPVKSHRQIVSKILSNASYWDYLSEGDFGDVYYFIVKNRFEFNKIAIKPGEYVLKIEKKNKYSPKLIERFEKLSNLNLIPKIYYMDDSIIIMKYIKGKELKKVFSELPKHKKEKVIENIEDLIGKWHSKGEAHMDLIGRNILVDKNLNVYFIDPSPVPKTIKDDFEDDWDALDFIKEGVFYGSEE